MKFKKILKEIAIFVVSTTLAFGFFISLTTKFNHFRFNYIVNNTINTLDTILFSGNLNILMLIVFIVLPYLLFLGLRSLFHKKIISNFIRIFIITFLSVLYYVSISYVFDCYIRDNMWGQTYFKGKYNICYTSNFGDPCFQYTSKVYGDYDSFIPLGKDLDSYAKDKNNVYYYFANHTDGDICADIDKSLFGNILKNADPNTFEVLSHGYARDKDNFYKNGVKFSIEDDGKKTSQITIASSDWASSNMILYKTSGGTGIVNFAKIAPSSFVAEIKNNPGNPDFVSKWVGSEQGQILINGGYFNEDNLPSGFLTVNRKIVGKEIFDQDKSGLLVLKNNQVNIRDLGKEPILDGEEFDFALQSYPFLIKNHEKAITADSGKKARRSAIGIDKVGNIYLLISDSPNLSLYEFMNILDDSEIGFENVLNLDGGPSSGLHINFDTYSKLIDSQVKVPNILKFKASNG